MTNMGKILKLMIDKQGEIIAQANGVNGFAIYRAAINDVVRSLGWIKT